MRKTLVSLNGDNSPGIAVNILTIVNLFQGPLRTSNCRRSCPQSPIYQTTESHQNTDPSFRPQHALMTTPHNRASSLPTAVSATLRTQLGRLLLTKNLNRPIQATTFTHRKDQQKGLCHVRICCW
jgi:hypothetical protein